MALIVSAINNMTSAKDSAILGLGSDLLTQEGVVDKDGNSFKVQQKGTPDMSVDVLSGYCYVQNDAWVNGSNQPKYYRVENDATVNKVINPNPSANPLIAVVCIKVDVGTLTPGATGNLAGTVEVIYGTAAASPVPPAIPNHHLPIAYIQYTSANTTITNALITDKRINISTHAVNLPEGTLMNGRIVRTISSNNQVVAIKTFSGDDPSANNPVWVVINGALRKITAALQLTIVGNKLNMNSTAVVSKDTDFFIYLAFKASDSTIQLLESRVPYAVFYGDFNASDTNEKGAVSTSAPASTDRVSVIGRVNCQINGSNQWSIPSSDIVINTPIFRTRWLSFTTVGSADAPMTFTITARASERYQIDGEVLRTHLSNTGTTGGSASNTIKLTMAMNGFIDVSSIAQNPGFVNEGTLSLGHAFVVAAAPGTFEMRWYDARNWGIATGRNLGCNAQVRLI